MYYVCLRLLGHGWHRHPNHAFPFDLWSPCNQLLHGLHVRLRSCLPCRPLSCGLHAFKYRPGLCFGPHQRPDQASRPACCAHCSCWPQPRNSLRLPSIFLRERCGALRRARLCPHRRLWLCRSRGRMGSGYVYGPPLRHAHAALWL